MARFGWLGVLASRVAALRGGRRRNAGVHCGDCPIAMRCGLEPQEQCLGKLEAIAAGKRRQVGAWDTGRVEIGVC